MPTDRRTLLRAGAWSVPVIATATAAPAMASSAGFYGSRIYLFDGQIALQAWTLGATLWITNDADSPGPQSGFAIMIKVSDALVQPGSPGVLTGATWQAGLVSDTPDGFYIYRYSYTASVDPGGLSGPLVLQWNLAGTPDPSVTVPLDALMVFPQADEASFVATS